MLSYQEFKDHLVTFLWKKGDQVLISSLDNLIRMSEAALNRQLLIERRHSSALITVDRLRVSLPIDYYSMRSIADFEGNLGEFKYKSPAELNALRSGYQNRNWLPYYSIEQNYLLFTGPAIDARKTIGEFPPPNPTQGDIWIRTSIPSGVYIYTKDVDSEQWVQMSAGEVTTGSETQLSEITVVCDYRTTVPRFKDADSSWLADEYLDLYTYSVLRQTAPFLREDERLQVWQAMHDEALASALDVSAFEQSKGTFASKPLPRAAGVSRRR